MGSEFSPVPGFAQLPMAFEPNRGQFSGSLDFLAKGPGYSVHLAADSVTLALLEDREPGSSPGPGRKEVIDIDLEGADGRSRGVGLDLLPGRTHYFRGSDPRKWVHDVRSYSRVQYSQVYPGIDVVYYGNGRQLEYDFLISAGANPNAIRLRIRGAQSSGIDDKGCLVMKLKSGGELTLPQPAAYQDHDGRRNPVTVRFKTVASNEFGFELGDYRNDTELVIDPYVVYFSAFGGSDSDWGNSIAVDAAGYVYVAGETISNDFPGERESDHGYAFDVFVTKIDPAGSSFVYSTVIGGSSTDYAREIKVTADGAAFLCGSTISADFPVTAAAVQTDVKGEYDAFALKLSPAGDSLVWSTLVGGTSDEGASTLALGQGQVFVAGATNSSDFPAVNSVPSIALRGPVRTNDGGATWDSSHQASLKVPVNDLCTHPSISGLIYAASRQGVYYSSDEGITWSPIPGSPIPPQDLSKVAVAPGGQVYAYGYSTLLRGTPTGDSWEIVHIPSGNTVNDIAFDPISGSRFYLACSEGLWRTTDAGSTWKRLNGQYSDLEAYSVAVNPQNALEVFVSTNGSGFWKSTNGGDSWSSIGSAYKLTTIIVDPANPSTLYALNGTRGLIKSTNSGAVWTFLGILGRRLAMAPTDPQTLYLGGDDGVKRTTDGGGTWSSIGWAGFLISGLSVSPQSGYVHCALAHQYDVFLSVFESDGSLARSTIRGGLRDEWVYGLAVDISGNVYLGGATYSSSFPDTTTPPGGGTDGYVLKLDAALDTLWSKRLVGLYEDTAWDLALGDHSVIVVGQTRSTDFPGATAHTGFPSRSDAFAVSIDPQNGTLLKSFVFGGPDTDTANALALDDTGRVHIAGASQGRDFPVTEPVWSLISLSDSHTFYAILTPLLDSIEYSVLFSPEPSAAQGIALDADTSAYLTGYVKSPATTSGPLPVCGQLLSYSLRQGVLIAKVSAGAGTLPSLDPSSMSVSASSGTLTIHINAPANAEWQATKSTYAPWLEVVAPGKGCGSGSVTLNYSANTALAPRSVEISIGTLKFVLNQSSAAPPLWLNNTRFRAELSWQTPNGSGQAQPVTLTSDSGYFWFFEPTNVEILVKVLDGTGVNGCYWVFYGALTDVAFTMTITDTVTGATRVYTNPQGFQAGRNDTTAFPQAAGASAQPVDPALLREHLTDFASLLSPLTGTSGNDLYLNQDRFRIQVDWRTLDGTTGHGVPVSLTSDSGYLWFFGPANIELVVKLLDGRGTNGHFWFFYGALTDVDYTVTVTDTVTGAVKQYFGQQGVQRSGLDIAVF